jgi:hypothetical protein
LGGFIFLDVQFCGFVFESEKFVFESEKLELKIKKTRLNRLKMKTSHFTTSDNVSSVRWALEKN